LEHALVAVDVKVVVDADDSDICGKGFEVGDERLPGCVIVAAVVLDDRFWRVDVEVPAAPSAAARVVDIRRG
jgi:hypothetical protein